MAMSDIKTLLASLIVVLTLSGIVNAKEWRGISPLRSTRSDVERLLGKSSHPCHCRYDLEKEVVYFKYSWADDPCATNIPFFPKVTRDTVLEIIVVPKERVLFKDLHFDTSKYQKKGDADLEYINYFENEEEGVLVEVGPCDEQVKEIYYQPAAGDDTPKCPEGSGILDPATPRKIDEYGFIGLKEERRRLDNLALALQYEQPGAEAYIIVHAGKSSSLSEARRRAERAKKYLLTKRGIEAEQVVALPYGSRDERIIELIVRPPTFPAPFREVKQLNCPRRMPHNKSPVPPD